MTASPQTTPQWQPLEAEWIGFIQLHPQQLGFESWLMRWSDLEGRLSSLETELRRRQYSNTTNQAASTEYATFTKQFMPKILEARKQLVELYLTHTPKKSGYLWQRFSNDQRLKAKSDANLLTQESALANRFNTVMGSLKAHWEGQSIPISKLAPLQASPERALREAAWRAEMEAKSSVAAELTEVYLELALIRERIAHSAGFPNYLEYRWLERERFGYTPQQCLEFAKAVAQHFGPLQQELIELRRQKLGVQQVHPWDISADLEGRAALKPYQNIEELLEKTKQVLRSIDPRLSDLLEQIQQQSNLEIEARANKSPSVFTDFYYDRQEPLIFMSANNTQASVSNLIHELGHCNHWKGAAQSQPYFWQQYAPIEFFEATAQALELIVLDHLSPFYSAEEIQRVKMGRAKTILFISTSMLAKEAFQHWVYSQPAQDLSPSSLTQQYLSVSQNFGQPFDFSGLEQYQSFGWQSSMVFWQPLYSIEYSMAWVGALLFYQRFLRQPAQSWQHYQESTQMGMSEAMDQLFDKFCQADPLENQQVAHAAGFLRQHFAGAFSN